MRNKEGVETKVLREPIPVLTAVMAAIADPFLTAPLMIKSTGEGLIENTSLISGLMHASPPSFVGMAHVFGQPSIARQYKSAKDFLMTEIQFDYDRSAEAETPTSIYAWTTQISSLLYTNKAMASNYIIKNVYKLYPDNLLRIATPFGGLEIDGVKNWDSYIDINTTMEL